MTIDKYINQIEKLELINKDNRTYYYNKKRDTLYKISRGIIYKYSKRYINDRGILPFIYSFCTKYTFKNKTIYINKQELI